MTHPLDAMETIQTERPWSTWQSWLDAWNRHDLDGVLAHYADDVVFTSNAVMALGFDRSGSVTGVASLRRVFEAGLRAYPDLEFTPLQAFKGVRGHVLYYVGIERRHVVEIHELDARGKIVIASAYHGIRAA